LHDDKQAEAILVVVVVTKVATLGVRQVMLLNPALAEASLILSKAVRGGFRPAR